MKPTKNINRNITRSAKSGWNWCLACDMARVADGSKCSNCGNRNNRRKEKRKVISGDET